MLVIILVIIFILFFKYVISNHLHIDFASLFRRGFAKKDDKFGLYCYTGVQGEGKTYSAVKFVNRLVNEHNYICITNVKSYKAFSNTIYMYDILDVIKYVIEHHDKDNKKYIIFFDEIFTVLMKSRSVNQDILAFLAQLRKRGIIFVTTAQYWSEIPITFRRFCRFQISCHMFALPFCKTAFTINKINDGYNARWNNDTQDFEAPVLQTNFAKAEKRIIEDYDTYETIKVTNKKY